jgi:hypothetical protein
MIVVLTVPGAATYAPLSLYVMQRAALIEDAVRGRLRLFGKPVYTRTFLPGEKVPDMLLHFSDAPCMTGVFRLPLPLEQGGSGYHEDVIRDRAAFGDTDMLHTLDPRYVPGRYKTTLRTIMHRHAPAGMYVLTGCRRITDHANRLPAIQAINFRAPFDRFVRTDTRRSSRGWPPQTAAQIKAYHDGLLAVSVMCERIMRRRAA